MRKWSRKRAFIRHRSIGTDLREKWAWSETIGKRFKRIIFASVVIFGLSGSSIALYKCLQEYLSFEVHTEQNIVEVREQPFPRVMLCLNSMHSKEKLRRYYPKLEKILGLLYYNMELNEQTLNAMKTGLMTEHSDRKMYEDVISVEHLLRSTTMWELVTKTSSHFKVSACRAGPVDCSAGWRDDYFQEGKCKSYIGSTAKTLDIITIYNKTDWSVGWKNFYDGFTLYYTEDDSKSVARSKSLQINPKNAAILELSRAKYVKLGKPYSQCIKNGTLKYSRAEYTVESCFHECKVDKVLKACGCRAPFFRQYEDLYTYPDCKIFDHIFCVKEILQKFDSLLRFDCNCTTTCENSELSMSSVQYGYPSLTINAPKDVSINSVFIEMNSRVESTEEKPRYPLERFMSDVGGSIAFFLGFSAPTIIIFLEKLMIKTMSSFQGRIARLSLNFHLSAVRSPQPTRRDAEFGSTLESSNCIERGDKLEKLNNVLTCSSSRIPATPSPIHDSSKC
ncbi:Oidioi.mRNA.OKI2018_I69.chr1.g1327.t2.cds [Oikopleura dioica]|uniref:Oidioi.mRNA.OKI2018_I69.chr1.g1327.t2.cds n=1 Tax=Oikopleura dioica TaxID=34765 RepID=A0ABN7SMK4_OIKDI|nr:Oidioi.mRNA.OKI2018_I69.chr1.g1327.t2.cds [Oikopleura dioica]